MYGLTRRIHFVGIGGSGMSGVAEVLLTLGYSVSGSDLKPGETTERIAALGGHVSATHAPENVHGAGVVVYSSAVHATNPELLEARRLGIPVIARAEMLAELMRLRYGVAIAGSHGKTTTTSMTGSVLAAGGVDPTVVVGGRLHALGGNARLGHGRFLVAEADESDGSFLRLSPVIAVITNIDREHLDYHKSFETLVEAFRQFAEKVPFYGAVVAGADDPAVASLLPRLTRRVLTYGITRPADVYGCDIELAGLTARMNVRIGHENIGRITLNVPGLHNLYNALAAIAVGWDIGVPAEKIREGLQEFRAVARRLEVKGEEDGIVIVDDYGHHPTEIHAVLAAVRAAFPERRIVTVFQPHRYTRTQALWSAFGECFYAAQRVILLPVYAAGEEPIPGVDASLIARAVRKHGPTRVTEVGGIDEALSLLVRELRPGDVVLTQGAGDVTRIGEPLLAALRARAAARASGETHARRNGVRAFASDTPVRAPRSSRARGGDSARGAAKTNDRAHDVAHAPSATSAGSATRARGHRASPAPNAEEAS
jgi:UDP-N-acetylmuramate--alanine ligase